MYNKYNIKVYKICIIISIMNVQHIRCVMSTLSLSYGISAPSMEDVFLKLSTRETSKNDINNWYHNMKLASKGCIFQTFFATTFCLSDIKVSLVSRVLRGMLYIVS